MKKISVLIAAAVVLSASPLWSGVCSWNTAPTNIDFGTYSVFVPTQVTANSGFSVRCGPNTTGQITLTRGTSSASYTPRTMSITTAPPAGFSGLLSYNLYTDAALTQIWGDGTGGSTVFERYNGTPQNKDFPDTIFGALPASSDAAPGTYTDTVTATLSWGAGTIDSRTFTTRVLVQAECTVSSFTIDFGSYDPLVVNQASPLDSAAVVNVYCTRGTPATVTLDAGSYSFGGTRRMRSAAGVFLNYDIYRDSSRATVWNTTNANSATSTSKTLALGGGFTAYARVFADQDVPAGTYKDTVQATVNY